MCLQFIKKPFYLDNNAKEKFWSPHMELLYYALHIKIWQYAKIGTYFQMDLTQLQK